MQSMEYMKSTYAVHHGGFTRDLVRCLGQDGAKIDRARRPID